MSTIGGKTVTQTVTLGSGTYPPPLTITASGAVDTSGVGPAIYGPSSGGPWTVINQGTIDGTGSESSGIFLWNGGFVSNAGVIIGVERGIFMEGGPGTVANLGTIEGTGPGWSGIGLFDGGSVTNERSGLIQSTTGDAILLLAEGTVTNQKGGFISGGANGVNNLASGTVVNYGTIEGSAGSGVYLEAGSVLNSGTIESAVYHGVRLEEGGAVTNYGVIEGALSGVSIHNDAGTVDNFGTIASASTGTTGNGVYLQDGGLVRNQKTGLVTAVQNNAVFSKYSACTAVNYGTIESSAGIGILLGGGSVANYGTVTGGKTGVSVHASAGTVINFGTIISTATGTLGAGVYLQEGGLVINETSGVIMADLRDGVLLLTGGILINSGTIEGYRGAYVAGGTIVDSGTIIGSSGVAVFFAGIADRLIVDPGAYFGGAVLGNGGGSTIELAAGAATGTLTNLSRFQDFGTFEIDTGASWVLSGSESGSVVNHGTVAGYGGLDTLVLAAGGYVGNDGTITSQSAGVWIAGGPGTVVNSGLIDGSAGYGVVLSAGGTVTNSGIIEGYRALYVADGTLVNAGTIIGSGGIAVVFAGGTDRLIVDPGAYFGGAVLGNGVGSTIELAAGAAAGTLFGLGTQFADFGTIKIDAGADWNLSGDARSFRFVNDCTILVDGALVFGAVGEDKGAHGVIDVGHDATAEFAGAVGKAQRIVFADAAGSVLLDRAKAFRATFSGFAAGDTIDLVGRAVDGLSFQHHQLVLTEHGRAVADLHFAGSYTTKEFMLSADGSGGTDITLTGAVAAGADFWTIKG